jgi:hypothetical protein
MALASHLDAKRTPTLMARMSLDVGGCLRIWAPEAAWYPIGRRSRGP